MNDTQSVHTLYGDVDNLSPFVNPTYGKKFDFMSDEQLLETAHSMARAIANSDYRKVVVSETGARPLASICERLAGRDWTYVKFPREATGNLYPLATYYLSDKERQQRVNGMSREERVRELSEMVCPTSLSPQRKPLVQVLQDFGRGRTGLQRQMATALEGTRIADALSQPFLFFDEYIDSGTTLQNADMYFKYFCGKTDFRTLTHFINVAKTASDSIFHTEYDADTRLQCYSKGAYPFENRVDLVGYFYYIDKTVCTKVGLEDIRAQPMQVDAADLLARISAAVDKHGLVEKVREMSSIPVVRAYVDANHVKRYTLAALEHATNGAGPMHEFLWQLFDMYGPVWSPMPQAYHLDFLHAFEARKELLHGTVQELAAHYEHARTVVLSQAADACLARKQAYDARIDNLLEGRT